MASGFNTWDIPDCEMNGYSRRGDENLVLYVKREEKEWRTPNPGDEKKGLNKTGVGAWNGVRRGAPQMGAVSMPWAPMATNMGLI